MRAVAMSGVRMLFGGCGNDLVATLEHIDDSSECPSRSEAPVRRRWLQLLACSAALVAALTVSPVTAQANPGAVVHPGMEVRQDTNVCTLGYVDPATRVGFTAGHCRGHGTVTDRDGRFIGNLAIFRDNTPDGSTVATDHQISDWEAIALAPDVQLNNVLPGGRTLVEDKSVVPTQGLAICHFGIVTGESCGTIEAVNNGWFTMTNGVVSQKGDSGGPVYVVTPDGRAVIIGMFNSTWGQFPAAVSWDAASRQAREDVMRVTAADLGNPGLLPAG
jgi:hypothetical protein